jgi:RNA polymerase sigma factor (sigma-70 family)
MPHDDDRQLWEALQRGERFAWERFFRATWRPAVRFATFHLHGDRSRAEDVCGESLLALLRDLGRYDPRIASLGSFLFGILKNRIQSELRRTRRQATSAPDLGEHASMAVEPEGSSSVVMQALMDLSVTEREMLLRHHEQRVNAAELARQAGVSLEAMQSRLRRARQRLAERLALRRSDDE